MDNMAITLYTTNCPRCTVLKKKLDMKGLSYGLVSDVNVMIDMGIRSAPVLMVNGELMDFSKAIEWVNQYPDKIDQNEAYLNER